MRKIINLNDNWQFIQKDVGLVNVMPTEWQTVNLPHTWNAVDGHDGNGSYDRGNYWYAKTFETPTQAFGGSKVLVLRLHIMKVDIQSSVRMLLICAKKMKKTYW